MINNMMWIYVDCARLLFVLVSCSLETIRAKIAKAFL
jgi:hypothetical protein